MHWLNALVARQKYSFCLATNETGRAIQLSVIAVGLRVILPALPVVEYAHIIQVFGKVAEDYTNR